MTRECQREMTVRRSLRPCAHMTDVRLTLSRDGGVLLAVDGERIDETTLASSPLGRALLALMREWRAT